MQLFMYVLLTLCSIIPALFFYQDLRELTGSYGILDQLVKGFDYNLFSDFVRNNVKGLIKDALMVFGIMYLPVSLLMTFASGGIIHSLRTDRFEIKEFIAAAWRFFGKNIIILLLVGLLLFCLFLVGGLLFFIGISLANGGNERTYFFYLLPPAICLALMLTFGLLVGIYAKIFIQQEPQIKAGSAFWAAFYYVFQHIGTFRLFYSILLIQGLCLAIYLFLDANPGMISITTMGLMFLIQQLLVWSKVWCKHAYYASAIHFVAQHPISLAKYIRVKVTELTEELIQSDESVEMESEEEGDEETKLSKPEDGL